MWKSILGGDEEQQQDNLLDEPEGRCSLSPSQRVYGFSACLLAGLVCMFLHSLPNWTWETTALILQIHSKILTIIAIICEICALIWYSLSYIPFALRMVSDVTIRLFDTEV